MYLHTHVYHIFWTHVYTFTGVWIEDSAIKLVNISFLSKNSEKRVRWENALRNITGLCVQIWIPHDADHAEHHLWVCACVCRCVFLCVFVRVCVCACASVHVHMHVCMCVQLRVGEGERESVCVWMRMWESTREREINGIEQLQGGKNDQQYKFLLNGSSKWWYRNWRTAYCIWSVISWFSDLNR